MRHNITAIGTFSFLALVFLVSCQKYDEGPLISLRSASQRLCNTRIVVSYTVDGVDSLGYLNEGQRVSASFYKGNDDKPDYLLMNVPLHDGNVSSGRYMWYWTFTQDNKEIRLERGLGEPFWGIFGNFIMVDWTITRLTKKELKMNTLFNGQVHEIYMIQSGD